MTEGADAGKSHQRDIVADTTALDEKNQISHDSETPPTTATPVTNMPEGPNAGKNHQSDITADAAATDEKNQTPDDPEATPKTTRKSFRFYIIILALALTNLLTSLEQTITSTALPTITSDLGGASLYVWVVNGYYLTQWAHTSLLDICIH